MAKRLQKGVELIRVNLGVEKSVYEKLLKLKIAERDDSTLNRYLNKKLGIIVNDNRVLIDGYEVDYSDFE